MAKDYKTYNIPQDSQPAMASEALAACTSQPVQDHIVLTIPHGVDADSVREKVNTYYTTLLLTMVQEQEFRDTLDKWLDKVGLYSGPNLCWDNEPFRLIQSKGPSAIAMIDRAYKTFPEYTHRHLGWLKRKLEEV